MATIHEEEFSRGVIIHSTEEEALKEEHLKDKANGLKVSAIYYADWLGRFQYEVRD